MSPQSDAESLFQRLLDADTALREAHQALLGLDDRGAVLAVLQREAARAMAAGADASAAVPVLLRMVDLLRNIDGRGATALLVRLLGHSVFEVEDMVHLALEERMSRCLAEVEEVMEAEVDRGEAADPKVLFEVSGILGLFKPSSALRVLTKLLRHPDGDVVGPAAEALVRLDDPSAIEALDALQDDPRPARMGNTRTEEGSVLVVARTVGSVARGAADRLRERHSG